MPDRPDLYLIDGHAQMFRAFFAIRTPMTSPVPGEPTNATYAFTGMLIKLFSHFKPTHAGMAIDPRGKTFRDDLFPTYKGTRDSPPETFAPQIPRMLEMCEAFGIKVIEAPGYEADDVMATLAARLEADCARIRLVSKDKDLMQCLTETVTLFDIHKDEELDLAGMLEKKGITPTQAIELQILTGDSVDNIPGVVGVGDKTGAKLLQEFGTIETLLERIDEIKGKRKENIIAARDQFDLVRTLVTLRTDTPVDHQLNDLAITAPDPTKIMDLCREFGFHRYPADVARLFGAEAPDDTAASNKNKTADANEEAGFGLFAGHGGEVVSSLIEPPADCQYESVTTTEQLQAVVDALNDADIFAFDTETLGLGPDTGLCGICLAWKTNHGVYIPTKLPPGDDATALSVAEVIAALTPALTDPKKTKVAHHLKYDYQVLKRAGLTCAPPFADTMIAAFLTGQPGMKMDDLALALLKRQTIPITQLIGEKKRGTDQRSMGDIELKVITPYAAEDADITLQLHGLLAKQVTAQGLDDLSDRIETPLVTVLADMEDRGITVDADVLRDQEDGLQKRIDILRREILDSAAIDFNPDSPKQLGDVLFNQLKMPAGKKTKTGYSTDSEVLQKLSERDDWPETVPEAARAIPALVLEYRQLTKLVGTYLVALREAIAEDGRVHCRFHQTGAATGRLSSSDPNLQNIPIRSDVGRDVRRAFVAADGQRLVAADYSQIELRLLAHLSDDESLIAAFHEGQDIHTAVAAQTFDVAPADVTREQRNGAKMINFGIVYGITAFGLARRLGEGTSRSEAQAIIDGYKQRFPGIDAFLGKCVQEAEADGYVTTILGRRRAIPQITSSHPQTRALGERLAINSVVQGSAADLIKLAMVQLDQRIADDSLPLAMLLQIHDELVCEAPEADAEAMGEILTDTMQSAMDLKVPLIAEASIGADWFAAK